jgi:HlyD family secretion protein
MSPPEPTPRRPPTRDRLTVAIGVAGLAALIVVSVGFGAFASIAGAVIAPGIVGIEGSARTVQHLEGGIVAQILVGDGDHVEPGDLLLRLETTEIDASLTVTETQLVEALARRARLEAERDGDTAVAFGPPPGVRLTAEEIARVRAGQQSLFEARREARTGEIEQLRRRVAQLGLQAQGFEAARDAASRQLAFVREELDTKRQLAERELTTRSEVLTLERAAAELEGQIAENGAESARARDAAAETEIRVLQVDRSFLEQVLAELRDAEADVTRLFEQQRALADRLRRADIRAPVAGTVFGMAANTEQGVIAPGSTILRIVPATGQLVIEVHIDPVDIDQVGAGQDAVIRFTAFDRNTTPELNGTVANVSADRLQDAVTGRPYYRVTIEVPAAERARLGDLQLMPGMPAEAFIGTGERSPLSYLLKPLADQIQRAFRDD